MSKDTPETIYWCPVCEGDIALNRVRKHFESHYLWSQVTREHDEIMEGLRWVAIKVLKAHGIDYYKSGMGAGSKKKYFPKPKKPESAQKSGVKIRTGRSDLPEYGLDSQDLWTHNRPLSGGGANGTGKRR